MELKLSELREGKSFEAGKEHQLKIATLSCVRLKGLHFDLNKAFLLPSAMPGLKALAEIYADHPGAEILAVGHTDTSGAELDNDALSLERAKAVASFLSDDAAAWDVFFTEETPEAKRWGAREIQLMLSVLPEGKPPFFGSQPTNRMDGRTDKAIRAFQKAKALTVDGIVGPKTRKALVEAYMGLDDTSLPKGTTLVTHGCGESFPEIGTGDGVREAGNRRVELFLFDQGIDPPPAGDISKPGAKDYPKWRDQVTEFLDVAAAGIDEDNAPQKLKQIELEDALFRTNSAVVLPEGEAPQGEGTEESPGERRVALTSIGAFARTLKFQSLHPEVSILIAGHTDTEGSKDFNKTLSGERAKAVHAVLTGDRDTFASICDKRHLVSDYKQILKWASIGLAELPQPPGFVPKSSFIGCDPGPIDDNAATGEKPLKVFQQAYNDNKLALGVSEQGDLKVDGKVGLKTWAAIFDCYEWGVRDELQIEPDELALLRDNLFFLPTKEPYVGFGESKPIEAVGKDHFRSQTNRRVEILFFEPGEEPNIAILDTTPEESEVYDNQAYDRVPLDVDFPLSETVLSPLRVFLLDENRKRMGSNPASARIDEQVAGAPYRMVFPNGEIRVGYADSNGMLTENEVPDFPSCKIQWGRQEDEEFEEPPQGEDESQAYFIFQSTLTLRAPRGHGQILEVLANMGHLGAEADQRQAFAEFYGDSENPTVLQVHQSGQPA